MFTGELKQEIRADWPLTYHRLTDKPKFDKTNLSLYYHTGDIQK